MRPHLQVSHAGKIVGDAWSTSLSYAQPSCYGWHDQEGRRTVTQAEGGEQGDPLMTLLFSIGIQGALEEVARSLERGEQLCAFLDDVYLLCQPSRVKTLFTVLSDALLRHAGIHLHQGKTKTWNSAGVIPDNVEDMAQRFGSQRASLCWARQSDQNNLSPGRWRNALRKSAANPPNTHAEVPVVPSSAPLGLLLLVFADQSGWRPPTTPSRQLVHISADRRPNPPRLMGREDNCFASGSASLGTPLRRAFAVTQMPSPCATQYVADWVGGMVRMEWFALG